MPPTVFSYPHPLSPENKMQEKAHIEKNKDGDHGCFEESRENGLNYRSGRDSFFAKMSLALSIEPKFASWF